MESKSKRLWWGHYHWMCDYVNGPCKDPGDFIKAIDMIKKIFPGEIGFRGWAEFNSYEFPCMYAKTQLGKIDLKKINQPYIDRMEEYLNIAGRKGCLVVLDAWDGYKGRSEFGTHPLHPSKNLQGSFDMFDEPNPEMMFPNFFQFKKRPEMAAFQENHLKLLAELVRDKPWVIISTGNEMVSDNSTEDERRIWHEWSARMIKKVSPKTRVMINDRNSSQSIFNLPEVDVVSFHACGGIYCVNGGHAGIPNWDIVLPLFKEKYVVLDNDGLWHCRSVSNAVSWGETVWNKVNDYGAKGPFPNDLEDEEQLNWEVYGVPLLSGLAELPFFR
jgi:hypothetical protein